MSRSSRDYDKDVLGDASPAVREPKGVLGFAATMTLVSAVMGAILGLGLGIGIGSGDLSSAGVVGSVFGGGVGLVVGLLVGSIRKLRALGSGPLINTILVFAGLGAIPGGLILSLFSEGLAMMMYQAVTGAIAGGLISSVSGTILRAFWRRGTSLPAG
jgi:hypothetical protein